MANSARFTSGATDKGWKSSSKTRWRTTKKVVQSLTAYKHENNISAKYLYENMIKDDVKLKIEGKFTSERQKK